MRQGIAIGRYTTFPETAVFDAVLVSSMRKKANRIIGEIDRAGKLFLVPADELLHGAKSDLPVQVFARGFSELDDSDQREILNLIEFKRAMKNRG